MLSKFLQLIKSHQYHIFLAICIGLISSISYNLGQINSLKKVPISIKESTDLKAEIFDAANSKSQTLNSKQAQNSKNQIQKIDTRVVVSTNSDKYHYSWCSGVKRIKDENKIWFETEADAQKAGYVKAGNCN